MADEEALKKVYEALRTSLSAHVEARRLNKDSITVRVRSRTASNTPVYKDYRLTLEIPL